MTDMMERLRGWLVISLAAAFFLIVVASQVLSGARFDLFEDRDPARVLRSGEPVLPQIRKQNRLVVLTRNAPTTYYLDRDEPAGFEHDLAEAFARHLGVEVEFRVMASTGEMLEALRRGEGHMIAANLIAEDIPQGPYLLGPSYASVRQQLVCNTKNDLPDNKEELAEASIMVLAESSYEARMKALASEVSGLEYATVFNMSTEDLMERVADGSIGCTVGDSTLVSINRRYHPELAVPFDLSGAKQMVWVLPEGAGGLQGAMKRWFAKEKARKFLKTLEDRYYGHVQVFDSVDLHYFRRRIRDRLPKFKPAFQKAGADMDLPWTLLAAMGYQESHWNARAKSPTGVRGLMMLTLPTAKELGVKNRLDAKQSIKGGAKYLARLMERLPESVTGTDRLWFALAAYNVGYGHLMDARALAKRLGRDPDRWTDLKFVLPLLAQPDFYKSLPHGYARGHEPVRYVQRIRNYHDILERHFPEESWQQAAADLPAAQ